MLKRVLKKIVPKVLVDLRYQWIKSRKVRAHDAMPKIWSGNYATWEDAKSKSTGYNAKAIFDKTAESILKVKRGEAVYERDSVIFDKPEYSWPLLTILLKIASENFNRLSVLDFGGSLGSSYFQNVFFFSSLATLEWSVVEQQHYIAFGNEKLADEKLRFYNTIEDCLSERNPPILLLSGVMQYIDDPHGWLNKIANKSFEYILFDRTAFIDDDRDRLTVQTVPESIYKASYPSWFFNKENIIRSLNDRYQFILDFDSGFTPETRIDGKRAYWNGLYFKRKK